MKKLSYFTLALTFMAFVACKSKSTNDNNTTTNGNDTMKTMVQPGASDQMNSTQTSTAKTGSNALQQDDANEAFGTDSK